MKIAVVGSGYVGLVAGACLAENGNDVVCVDKDAAKIRLLQRGKIPIYEPGLEEMVRRNRAEKRLTFTTALPRGVRSSQIIFIAVGTPTGEDGSADLQHVLGVAREIGRSMDGYKVIVNKSTVPIGSSRLVERIIRERLPAQIEFDVASNPEFLREGSAVFDFMHTDRVVIGTNSERAAGLLTELYRPLGAPLIVTDPATAEMIKYASNAFLATKISFINAIANICEAAGADVVQVMKGMGQDQRIGSAFLQAGLGYGGSCFPKDSMALIGTGHSTLP